jgi:hypothetical protein
MHYQHQFTLLGFFNIPHLPLRVLIAWESFFLSVEAFSLRNKHLTWSLQTCVMGTKKTNEHHDSISPSDFFNANEASFSPIPEKCMQVSPILEETSFSPTTDKCMQVGLILQDN